MNESLNTDEKFYHALTDVTKSQQGLRYIAWSLLLYLIYLAILAIILVVSITHIVGTTAFIPAFIPIYAILPPLALLLLAQPILFIKGFFALYSHSHGLGPKHEKNMGRSLLLFIGIVVVLIPVQIVVIIWTYLTVFPSPMVVRHGLGVFVTFLIGLLLYFIVSALVTTELQSRLKLAVVLLVLGSVAGYITFTVGYLTDGFLISALQDSGNFIFLAPNIQYQDVLGGLFSSSLAIAATFLFWWIYHASHEAM